MLKTGDFVTQQTVNFQDNIVEKDSERPCLVLFSFDTDNGSFVCTCPITNQIDAFNRHPENYFLIPIAFKSAKKISFAKIDCADIYRVEETTQLGMCLDIPTTMRVLGKIRTVICDKEKETVMRIINDMISLNQLEKREEKSLKKKKY